MVPFEVEAGEQPLVGLRTAAGPAVAMTALGGLALRGLPAIRQGEKPFSLFCRLILLNSIGRFGGRDHISLQLLWQNLQPKRICKVNGSLATEVLELEEIQKDNRRFKKLLPLMW